MSIRLMQKYLIRIGKSGFFLNCLVQYITRLPHIYSTPMPPLSPSPSNSLAVAIGDGMHRHGCRAGAIGQLVYPTQ